MYEFLLLMIRSFLEGFSCCLLASSHTAPTLHIISHIASEEPLFSVRAMFEVFNLKIYGDYMESPRWEVFLYGASTGWRPLPVMLNGHVTCHYCTYSNKRVYEGFIHWTQYQLLHLDHKNRRCFHWWCCVLLVVPFLHYRYSRR